MTKDQMNLQISVKLNEARKAFEQAKAIPFLSVAVMENGTIVYCLSDRTLNVSQYLDALEIIRRDLSNTLTKNTTT